MVMRKWSSVSMTLLRFAKKIGQRPSKRGNKWALEELSLECMTCQHCGPIFRDSKVSNALISQLSIRHNFGRLLSKAPTGRDTKARVTRMCSRSGALPLSSFEPSALCRIVWLIGLLPTISFTRAHQRHSILYFPQLTLRRNPS